jgi:hypothetical protein
LLRSRDANIPALVTVDLKSSILTFDALIAGE